jgi:recombinational DNA repair protein (RecF pathway)
MHRKNLKDELIIIRRQTVNENDVLLTAYGKTLGKIFLKAKGSKKITSRFTGKLEILSCINADLYFSGRSYTLTNASLLQEPPIGLNLQNFQITHSICKLLNQTLAMEDPNQTIFHLIQLTTQFLRTEHKEEEILLFFYLKYLQLNGHLAEIKELYSQSNSVDKNSLKALRFFTENNELSQCLKLKLPQENKLELQRIVQRLIQNSFEINQPF